MYVELERSKWSTAFFSFCTAEKRPLMCEVTGYSQSRHDDDDKYPGHRTSIIRTVTRHVSD